MVKILANVSTQEIQEGLKAVDVLAGAEWEFLFTEENAEKVKQRNYEVENQLEKVINSELNVRPWLSNESHSTTRSSGWILEKDTSLPERTGAELISPPMPLQKFLKICPRILKVIDKIGVTTQKCGLHINLSVKNSEQISALKLLLLIDEDLVYSIFNKESRKQYASPVKEWLKQMIESNIEITAKNLKSGSLQGAKIIEDALEPALRNTLTKDYGINAGKLQQGYVEFRYMGGQDYHLKWDKIKNLIGMYVFILKASTDSTYKDNEYRTRLSRVINEVLTEHKDLIQDTKKWIRKFTPFLKAFDTKIESIKRSPSYLFLDLKKVNQALSDTANAFPFLSLKNKQLTINLSKGLTSTIGEVLDFLEKKKYGRILRAYEMAKEELREIKDLLEKEDLKVQTSTITYKPAHLEYLLAFDVTSEDLDRNQIQYVARRALHASFKVQTYWDRDRKVVVVDVTLPLS